MVPTGKRVGGNDAIRLAIHPRLMIVDVLHPRGSPASIGP